MATCANCSVDAFYTYSVTPEFPIYFCSKHLPKFLKDQRFGGSVTRYEAPTAPAAPKSKKSSAKEPVIEEPAEEPVVEEAPTEE